MDGEVAHGQRTPAGTHPGSRSLANAPSSSRRPAPTCSREQLESIASLPAALLRILEASAARYVLRYEPTGVPRVGRHRLKVSVRRRGVEVRARQEYTVSAAPPP